MAFPTSGGYTGASLSINLLFDAIQGLGDPVTALSAACLKPSFACTAWQLKRKAWVRSPGTDRSLGNGDSPRAGMIDSPGLWMYHQPGPKS